MPAGTEFITHEFDEAIAIQQSICNAGTKLSDSHPVAAVKRQLAADLEVDQRHLVQLIRIAEDRDETDVRDAAAEMKREIKASADALGTSLADFAVQIASA